MKIIVLLIFLGVSIIPNPDYDSHCIVDTEGVRHEYFYKPDSSGSYMCMIHFEEELVKIIK